METRMELCRTGMGVCMRTAGARVCVLSPYQAWFTYQTIGCGETGGWAVMSLRKESRHLVLLLHKLSAEIMVIRPIGWATFGHTPHQHTTGRLQATPCNLPAPSLLFPATSSLWWRWTQEWYPPVNILVSVQRSCSKNPCTSCIPQGECVHCTWHAFSRLVTPHQRMHTHSHSMGLHWSTAHARNKRVPQFTSHKDDQNKMVGRWGRQLNNSEHPKIMKQQR